MKEFDLKWGDPFIVRQALTESLGYNFSSKVSLESLGYPPHLGTIKLIEQLKLIAERQSGHKPKHLFITNGATGAINAALYALKTQRTDWIVANGRYFPFYPAITGLTDMILINHPKKKSLITSGLKEHNFLSLVDSPSNPEGRVFPFEPVDIWDSAYASKTYTNGGHIPISHRIMCGSLSKTLGLAGLRIGWASTDDDALATSLSIWITANYSGLSNLSAATAEEILDKLNLDAFEKRSSKYLDHNREEMQRILTAFGQGDVPSRGMFAVLELGKHEKKALEKANIKWLPGSMWGDTDDWARLSLGQTRELTKAAVKAVLK